MGVGDLSSRCLAADDSSRSVKNWRNPPIRLRTESSSRGGSVPAFAATRVVRGFGGGFDGLFELLELWGSADVTRKSLTGSFPLVAREKDILATSTPQSSGSTSSQKLNFV